MSNQYEPKTQEPHWQQRWEAEGVYHFKDDLPKDQTFVIDTPPPTVSGVLHMGHIFSYTQADFIARYKRMRGMDVFYPMGFDDNGLPTERLVEKVKKIRAHNYIEEHGREAFVELCQDVVDEAEAEFKRLFQSVALSVDWNQLYQTISKEVTALSQASFLDLIEKGEAYRDFRPTYWDWKDQTAIATAETEEQEMEGIQCHIPFGIMDASEWEKLAANPDMERPDFDSLEHVIVMTTRPELLGACVALMVNPEDAAAYEGKVAVSPLFNVVVPICADEKVDKEKGTGFVMCCSWGDDTDKEWIIKHELAWRPLFNTQGRVSLDHTPLYLCAAKPENRIAFLAGREGHRGNSYISSANCLDIEAAKSVFATLTGTKLIRDIKDKNSAKGVSLTLLEEANLLRPMEGQDSLVVKRVQMVKCAERSGCPIEIIPTHQWFVRIMDKKEALKDKAAQCNWNPEFMKLRLDQWTDGLKEDWCISRQRFFGVPFPVWYIREEGNPGEAVDSTFQRVYADRVNLPIDPFSALPQGYEVIEKGTDGSFRAKKEGKIYWVIPDKDVMDTWATSSISPQINARGAGLGNNANPQSLTPNPKLYPADLRPQAHEIIRTWAFYTIVKSHLHSNSIPWKNLMISGWCLASDKTKMSKSKGNVVTPVELIEDKGADAVRYWASTSRLGADTAFSEDLLKIGKKLVTKLYNASNFAGQHLSKIEVPSITAREAVERGIISETLDQWILSRLHGVVQKATEEFEKLEYATAREAIEGFFWNDFCDNYLELVKARAYNEEGSLDAGQQSAIHTLHYCLNTLLKLFAPYVPHITEELYTTLFASEAAQKGSIHSRGQWPDASDFANHSESETLGKACVELLEVIRKTKSEARVSIKYPVASLCISKGNFGGDMDSLRAIMDDLKAAGNVEHVDLADHTIVGTATESNDFQVSIQLAEPSTHAAG